MFCRVYNTDYWYCNCTSYYCGNCSKKRSFCTCKGTSDPFADKKEPTKTPSNVESNPTKLAEMLKELEPPQLADQLQEIAIQFNLTPAEENNGGSAYLYFIERCRMAAKRGIFDITFKEDQLFCWSWEQLELAIKTLHEKDNFAISIKGTLKFQRTITISWAEKKSNK